MATNNTLLAQFGDQLDGLAPGALFKREFDVYSKLFGTETEAATREAATKFGKRHHCTFRHDREQGLGIFKCAD